MRMEISNAVPGPKSGGIAKSPVRRDTTPVAASTATKGSAVIPKARSRGRGPVAHGTPYAVIAPTRARIPAKTTATKGFQFMTTGGDADASLTSRTTDAVLTLPSSSVTVSQTVYVPGAT